MIEKREKLDMSTPVALDFYTIDQLALRFDCAKSTIREYIRKGKLKGVQVGKPLIFSAANVQAFLKSLESETSASQKKSEVMNAKKKKPKTVKTTEG